MAQQYHKPITECVIYWDYENCPIPRGSKLGRVIDVIKNKIIESLGGRSLPFRDIQLYVSKNGKHAIPPNVLSSLDTLGVDYIPIESQKPETVDKRILADIGLSIFDWKDTKYNAIVVISGDKDFGYLLSKIKQRHIAKTIVIPRLFIDSFKTINVNYPNAPEIWIDYDAFQINEFNDICPHTHHDHASCTYYHPNTQVHRPRSDDHQEDNTQKWRQGKVCMNVGFRCNKKKSSGCNRIHVNANTVHLPCHWEKKRGFCLNPRQCIFAIHQKPNNASRNNNTNQNNANNPYLDDRLLQNTHGQHKPKAVAPAKKNISPQCPICNKYVLIKPGEAVYSKVMEHIDSGCTQYIVDHKPKEAAKKGKKKKDVKKTKANRSNDDAKGKEAPKKGKKKKDAKKTKPKKKKEGADKSVKSKKTTAAKKAPKKKKEGAEARQRHSYNDDNKAMEPSVNTFNDIVAAAAMGNNMGIPEAEIVIGGHGYQPMENQSLSPHSAHGFPTAGGPIGVDLAQTQHIDKDEHGLPILPDKSKYKAVALEYCQKMGFKKPTESQQYSPSGIGYRGTVTFGKPGKEKSASGEGTKKKSAVYDAYMKLVPMVIPMHICQQLMTKWLPGYVKQKKVTTSTFDGNIQLYDPIVQSNIALLGFFNKYLSGFKNGKFELKQDNIGSNEVFTSIPVAEGIETQKDSRCKVCFQLDGTNLHLCCEKNGRLALRKHRKKWETWVVEQDNKSGMFAFKSYRNTYLCAQKGKPSADRKKKGDWEKWRVVVVQKSKEEQTGQATKQPVDNQSTKGNTASKQPQQQQVAMAQNNGSYYNQPGSSAAANPHKQVSMAQNDGSYY